MKRIFFVLVFALFCTVAMYAQAYKSSRYYNPETQRLDYGYKSFLSKYYGLRIGVNFARVSASDDIHACDRRARLNLGAVVGYGLVSSAPLYLETGLGYTAKGGKKSSKGGETDYNLDYLQIPLVLKYIYTSDGGFGIQPFFGGYFSCGIAGSVKDYVTETSYSSFSDNPDAYKRFDGGLRFGVGLSYSVAYIEMSYELGLANISHDTFNPAHNRDFMLIFGVNF